MDDRKNQIDYIIKSAQDTYKYIASELPEQQFQRIKTYF